MEGFQLWLNLPKRDKMIAPWYRDFKNSDLPQFATDEGVAVTVIAGQSHGVIGAVRRDMTQPHYLDLHMPAGVSFEQQLPADHNAFVYVYRGEASIAGQAVPMQRMAILTNDAQADGVVIETNVASRLLLISGKPLGDPIVQYGPFVMNSEDEIRLAISDFRNGRLA